MNANAGRDVAELAVAEGAWRLSGVLTFGDVGAVYRASQNTALPASGVIDLGGLLRVDSAALALLLAFKRRAATESATLRFTGTPPAITSLARVYGVEGLLAA